MTFTCKDVSDSSKEPMDPVEDWPHTVSRVTPESGNERLKMWKESYRHALHRAAVCALSILSKKKYPHKHVEHAYMGL